MTRAAVVLVLAMVAGGLAQTCPVGQGWQPGADTEVVALSRMVGTFLPMRCKMQRVLSQSLYLVCHLVSLCVFVRVSIGVCARSGGGGREEGEEEGGCNSASSRDTQRCRVFHASRVLAPPPLCPETPPLITFMPLRITSLPPRRSSTDTNNHVAAPGFAVSISDGDVGLLTDRGGQSGTGDGSDFGNFGGASSFRLIVAGTAEDTVKDPNFPGDEDWFFTRCMCEHNETRRPPQTSSCAAVVIPRCMW